MQTRKRSQYVVELPQGIPVLAGHFGSIAHKAGKERYLLFFHEWDFLFVEKGRVVFQLRNQGTITLSEGHFLLLPPSIPVWFHCPKPSRLGFCHISFESIPDKVFPSVRKDCLEIGRRVLMPWTFSKNEAPKFWLAYRRVITLEFDTRRPWKMACAVARMVSELGAFALKLNLVGDQPILSPSEGLDPRIIDVCRRISRDPFQRWKVSELAASLGISTGHLDRLFRTNLQIKLKGFIIERRLQRALRYVTGRNLERKQSLKEISVACGFSSQHFFSRQFRKFYGVSPAKYRAREPRVHGT